MGPVWTGSVVGRLDPSVAIAAGICSGRDGLRSFGIIVPPTACRRLPTSSGMGLASLGRMTPPPPAPTRACSSANSKSAFSGTSPCPASMPTPSCVGPSRFLYWSTDGCAVLVAISGAGIGGYSQGHAMASAGNAFGSIGGDSHTNLVGFTIGTGITVVTSDQIRYKKTTGTVHRDWLCAGFVFSRFPVSVPGATKPGRTGLLLIGDRRAYASDRRRCLKIHLFTILISWRKESHEPLL